jgi:uncharacterized glyoxalase superfamily protein PhnB
MKLASIRLVTREVDRLAAFYEELTGTARSVIPGFTGYAEIRLEGFTLAIASEEAVRRFHPAMTLSAAAILELEVANVDRERERLEGFVTDWVQQPTTMPWGNRSMLFRDPDGTMINVYARGG